MGVGLMLRPSHPGRTHFAFTFGYTMRVDQPAPEAIIVAGVRLGFDFRRDMQYGRKQANPSLQQTGALVTPGASVAY